MKVHTVKSAKLKAWNQFSKYIRLRDSLRTTKTQMWVTCVSCDRPFETKTVHAGHFIQGRGKAYLFLEDNVHAQCRQCNFYKQGNLKAYRMRMVELYGEDRVEELENLRHSVGGKWTVEELMEIYQTYKLKYEELLRES